MMRNHVRNKVGLGLVVLGLMLLLVLPWLALGCGAAVNTTADDPGPRCVDGGAALCTCRLPTGATCLCPAPDGGRCPG